MDGVADEQTEGGAAGQEPEADTAPAPEQEAAAMTAGRAESAPPEPAADAPAEPVAETPTEAPVDAPVEPVAEAPAEPAAEAPAEPAAEAPAEPAAEAPAEPAGEAPAEAPAGPRSEQGKGKPKGKGKGKRRDRRPRVPPDLPRTRAPLPLDELRDASRSTLELFGRDAVRDSFLILGPKERNDLSALVGQDEDHRPRARNIANGSLGAGRIDKAMAATIISMAPREDLWATTLDKEQAAQKLGRVRAAKQRDKQKAERARERENRADRVSREDLKKAQDGRVGATIRFVTPEDKRDRRKSGDEQQSEPPPKRDSVLDKLGY